MTIARCRALEGILLLRSGLPLCSSYKFKGPNSGQWDATTAKIYVFKSMKVFLDDFYELFEGSWCTSSLERVDYDKCSGVPTFNMTQPHSQRMLVSLRPRYYW
jgi:hypothetical protein